ITACAWTGTASACRCGPAATPCWSRCARRRPTPSPTGSSSCAWWTRRARASRCAPRCRGKRAACGLAGARVMNMMDIQMREDIFLRTLLGGGTTFDWLTVLSLFLVGLFFLLPQIQNHTLSGRARACFLGALWILVVKLFLNLIKTLLINLDLFNNIVRQRGP